MSEDLQKKLEDYIEESIDLRFKFTLVDFGAEATELHRALVLAQDLLSQLEYNLSKATRAKALLERRVAKHKMAWQEAWDKAVIEANKRPTLGDYATGKERAAEANLATLMLTRQLRIAEEMLSFANEAVDIIRLHYYGLDKARQDVRKRLDMSQTDYYS